MTKAARKPSIYRHRNHAEWGHGIIVEENPRRVYLQFENGGRRAFVNDARYREQLLGVELPSSDAAAVLATLEKFLPQKSKVKAKATSRRKKPVADSQAA